MVAKVRKENSAECQARTLREERQRVRIEARVAYYTKISTLGLVLSRTQAEFDIATSASEVKRHAARMVLERDVPSYWRMMMGPPMQVQALPSDMREIEQLDAEADKLHNKAEALRDMGAMLKTILDAARNAPQTWRDQW